MIVELLNRQDKLLDDLLKGKIVKLKVSSLICGEDEVSQRRRAAFLKKFTFGRPLLPALRHFLSSFALVGETQEQDRILHEFSKRYFDCTGEFTVDIIHAIVYSCILLNTDLHISENEKKMTCNEYVSNTTGAIYDSNEKVRYEFPDLEQKLRDIYKDISNGSIAQPHIRRKTSSFAGVKTIFRRLSMKKSGQAKDLYEKISQSTSMKHPAPFREGLLSRKHVLSSSSQKANERRWHICFCRVSASDLLMFDVPAISENSITFEEKDLKLQMYIPLRHILASSLPRFGYSKGRPYCFQLLSPNGGLYLFQTYSESSAHEWCQILNYWSAIESREPLSDGIGMWYGIERNWLMDFVPVQQDQEQDDEKPKKSVGCCRVFRYLSENAVSTYSCPSLPFVPQSMAAVVEEMSLKTLQSTNDSANQNVSKLYEPTKPLGFVMARMHTREYKLGLWRRRLEMLCLELEELVYVRELLRCFGIGRGVVDLSKKPVFGAVSSSLTSFDPKKLDDLDFDNMWLDEFEFGSALLDDTTAANSTAVSTRRNSIKGNFAMLSGYWKPEIHEMFSRIHREALTVVDHKSLEVKFPENFAGSELHHERSEVLLSHSSLNLASSNHDYPIVLPAPLNIKLCISALPDLIFKAMINSKLPESEDAGSLQNLVFDNPVLAQMIDDNWYTKFRFVSSEILKTYHYVKTLDRGVLFTPISQALIVMKKRLESTSAQDRAELAKELKPNKLRKRAPVDSRRPSTGQGNRYAVSSLPLGMKSLHIPASLRSSELSLTSAFTLHQLQSEGKSEVSDAEVIREFVTSPSVSRRMKEFIVLEKGEGVPSWSA